MGRKSLEIDIDGLVKVYKQTSSISQTAKKFKITPWLVRDRLVKFGVKMNKRGGSFKYSCNDRFFNTDTPESFYWAGMLAADGCVRSSYNDGYTICLALKDIEHIRKFKSCIDSNAKIFNYTNIDFYSITIHSKKMFKDLSRFGIVPRKTKIYNIPKHVMRSELVNHFLRGYIDGDGCWSIVKPRGNGNRNTLRVHICGTPNLINKIIQSFHIHCRTARNKKIYWDGSVANASYEGNVQCKVIRDFLYKGAHKNIYLERKYNIAYNDWVDNLSLYTRVPVVGRNIRTGEILILDSVAQAENYGFNHSGVSEACSGKRKLHKGYVWKKFNKGERL